MKLQTILVIAAGIWIVTFFFAIGIISFITPDCFEPKPLICSKTEITNIVSWGLPLEMEKQAENWLQAQPIGTTQAVGECSTAKKTFNNKWELTLGAC